MANAARFGASADGMVDDTAALQHAIDSGDGVLTLNKGTYRISRPLVLDMTKRGYISVRGKGGTSRIIMTGPGPALKIVGSHDGTASPKSYLPATWEKERFPTIEGLEIVGAHPEAVGIELRKTTKCVITRVLVRECLHGVHLVERNRDFILSDSHLYNNREYGLFLDRCNLHQIIVHGCHISWNKKGGIRSIDGDVHNMQITGNDIEYNNDPGVDVAPNDEPRGAELWFEAPTGRISELTIASNTIQATIQPGGANIRIWGGAERPSLNAVLIAITGNVLGSQTRGIELRHAQRVTIVGNTLYAAKDVNLLATHCTGIAVGTNTVSWQGTDEHPVQDGFRLEDCKNSSIVGLVAQRLSAGTPESGGGISLIRCTDVAVGECQLIDSVVRGIDLEDCIRCRISSNSIVDSRNKPTMRQAIRVRGKSRDNLVQNNLISGATEKGIDAPPETATVQGNVETPPVKT